MQSQDFDVFKVPSEERTGCKRSLEKLKDFLFPNFSHASFPGSRNNFEANVTRDFIDDKKFLSDIFHFFIPFLSVLLL